jgi:long-subunit fatty acid transport protein
LTRPGFGETRLSGTLKTKLGTSNETNDEVELLQKYPDIIRFGVAGKVSKDFELRADFEYVFWHVFQRQCLVKKGAPECAVDEQGRSLPANPADPSVGQVIQNVPRKWHDAIGVRAGPAYWLNDKTELFGSLGMTTPAVPVNTIDAGTIDALRLYFTAGLRYEIDKHWAIAGSYNHIYFFPVDTEGRNDQNIQNGPTSDFNSSRSPSADGKYRSQIGFLNLNVGYTF